MRRSPDNPLHQRFRESSGGEERDSSPFQTPARLLTDCQRNPSGALQGQCDGYLHPRYHLIATYARTDTANIGCLPSIPPLLVLGRTRYTHRLLFHSTPIEDSLPASFFAWTTHQSVRPPTPARLGYLHTAGVIGSQGAPPPPSPQAISLTALVLAAQQPNPDFFFLLVRSAPNEGRFCAEPGSSLQGLHFRSTPTTTRAHLHLFTLLVLTNHPIVRFDSPPLPVCPCRKPP